MKMKNKSNILFLLLCVVGYFLIVAPAAQGSILTNKDNQKNIFPDDGLDLVLSVDDSEKSWNWDLSIGFGPIQDQQDLIADMSLSAEFLTKIKKDEDDFQFAIFVEDSNLEVSFEDNQTEEPVDALSLARIFGYPIDETLEMLNGYIGTMLLDGKGALLTFDIGNEREKEMGESEYLYWVDYRDKIESSRYEMLDSGIEDVVPWMFGYIPLDRINSDYSKEWNIANIMKVFDFWYEQEKEWNEDVPSEEEYVYIKDFLESIIPEMGLRQALVGVEGNDLVFSLDAFGTLSLEDLCLAMESMQEVEEGFSTDDYLGEGNCSDYDMRIILSGDGELVINSENGMLVSRSMDLMLEMKGYLPSDISPSGVEIKLDFPLFISETLN